MSTRAIAAMCVILAGILSYPAFAQTQEETQEWLEDLTREVESLKRQVGVTAPGTTKALFAGYASADFMDRDGADASFGGGFNPIFLLKLGDNVLFESELAIELEEGETNTELEYSHITFLANDSLTLGVGKFLAPFNIFSERLHPTWINRLPDAPLAFSHGTGIAPPALLGADARGGMALGSSKVNYALYVANGPTLAGVDADGAEPAGGHEAAAAGALEFDNYDNAGDNVAYGGRVGWLPIPEMEIGYSVYRSDVANVDGAESDVLLQGVDLSYVRDSELLRGKIDLRVEWVWSDAGDVAVESEGEEAEEAGPEEEREEEHSLTLVANERSGGYVQFAYQPTKAIQRIIKNLEFVGRYDMVDLPGGLPLAMDEERVTVGVNYWLNSSTVVKGAYQFDAKSGEGTQDQDAVLLQVAMGF